MASKEQGVVRELVLELVDGWAVPTRRA